VQPSDFSPDTSEDSFRSIGVPVHVSTWQALWSSVWPSLRFLFQTEVHVYSFAVAANILLSFFPFLVAITALCRFVLHWQAAVDVIIHTVTNYFPDTFGVNFRAYMLSASRSFSWISVFLLLFTANGIFVPLEVAFNRIWRIEKNRSFIRNQAVSLGLIFLCGALVLGSTCLTTVNVQFLTARFGSSHLGAVLQAAAFRLTAVPITVLMIFLIYWILPNARIPVRRLIPASVSVAALLELSQYINIWTWPYLRAKLRTETPPFVQSISIILWSFIGTMIVLAGAEWSSRVSLDSLGDDES